MRIIKASEDGEFAVAEPRKECVRFGHNWETIPGGRCCTDCPVREMSERTPLAMEASIEEDA
jgi:hypothetical protein